ncbi:MAG: hypothetical protein NTY45_08150 [Elusimicrobia bacterium]|nr:hypothetical protein [Elusimicrobiota bacterium]
MNSPGILKLLRLTALTAVLSLACAAQGRSGEPPVRRSGETPDLTAEYLAAFSGSGPEKDETLLRTLRGYRILFVPGFLSDVMVNPALLDKRVKIRLGTYFDSQIAWLRAGGVDARIVNIESEESVEFNAVRIAESINRSPLPVILIAHSKGGLDALEALLAWEKTAGKVSGVITIQSPFLGTPMADYVLKNRFFDTTLWAALALLGGSEMSLLDLSTDTREIYHRDNAAAIAGLTAKIPFICFGSWIDNDERQMDTELALIRDFLLAFGLNNDGVVPSGSALLPGAYSIVVEGPDHMVTVKDEARLNLDRIKFIKILLELLGARIAERTS